MNQLLVTLVVGAVAGIAAGYGTLELLSEPIQQQYGPVSVRIDPETQVYTRDDCLVAFAAAGAAAGLAAFVTSLLMPGGGSAKRGAKSKR